MDSVDLHVALFVNVSDVDYERNVSFFRLCQRRRNGKCFAGAAEYQVKFLIARELVDFMRQPFVLVIEQKSQDELEQPFKSCDFTIAVSYEAESTQIRISSGNIKMLLASLVAEDCNVPIGVFQVFAQISHARCKVRRKRIADDKQLFRFSH